MQGSADTMSSSRELLEGSMRMLQVDWMVNLEVNRTTGGLHGHGHDDEMNGAKPWGEVFFASILINLTTLMGVFLWAAALARRKSDTSSGGVSTTVSILTSNMFDFVLMPSFAAGALIATAVFLIIPESIELLGGASLDGGHGDDDHAGHGHRWLEDEEDAHAEHGSIAWKFGASLMAGYLLPILLGALFPLPAGAVTEEEQQPEDVKDKSIDDDKKEQAEEVGDRDTDITDFENSAPPPPLDLALASSILLGDGFHNLVDGIFVGNAFLLCDKSVAYTIAATTIYHEIAQELADYVLLTSACGLSSPLALALNFASGFSVLLGAFLILALDVTPEATGAMLALSAGVYIFIAASECMPLVQAQKESRSPVVKLACILMFAVGAVPIGLVLISHSHGCAH